MKCSPGVGSLRPRRPQVHDRAGTVSNCKSRQLPKCCPLAEPDTR
jgi:hypothetical protein